MKTTSLFVSILLLCFCSIPIQAQVLINFNSKVIQGDSKIEGYNNWVQVESISFGVEREMKESGEKGGTQDINIGVGELSPIELTKSFDKATLPLMQMAVNGNAVASEMSIHFLRVLRKPYPYLEVRLIRPFVKNYQISGSEGDNPEESFELYYNGIELTYKNSDGKVINKFSWDVVKNKPLSK